MLLRLLLLFTLIPVVELTLLFWLARDVGLGWGWTLVLVFTTGIVGAALARREGLRCWQKVRERLAAGELPGDPLLDALLIFLAGGLLITPGVLTDLLGLALLLPGFRRMVKAWLVARFLASFQIAASDHPWTRPDDAPAAHDRIVDVRVLDTPPERSDDT